MSKYKESVLKSLKKEAKATEKLTADFFDTNKTVEQRLKSFGNSGSFNERSDIDKAIEILKDANQDAKLRAAATLGLIHEVSKNEDLIDYLIQALDNPEAPMELKEAALSVMQANTFVSPVFPSKRAAYMNALRNIAAANEPSAKQEGSALKARAIEFLALEKDEYIQRRLIEGLEKPNEEIVKPEVAIQLLSYDLHSDYYPVLRKIAQNPPNKRSKKEALRNLAADPDSVDLLLETLKDKNEDKQTRHVCAVGLQSLAPEKLQENVKELLTDSSEDGQLQVALLNTIAYAPNTKIIDEDEDFQSKLNAIQEESTSKKLKKVYKEYRQNKL